MRFFTVLFAFLVICQLVTVIQARVATGCTFMQCQRTFPRARSTCSPGYTHYKYKRCGGPLSMKKQEICCPAATQGGYGQGEQGQGGLGQGGDYYN